MANKVVNTSRDESHPEWTRGGSPTSIEAQEARGQAQLMESDVLPVKGSDGLEKLGFKLGEPSPDDPLFRPVTFPPGWTKKPAPDHSMWSYLYDDKGRERGNVFYKAAFYDRRADMHFVHRYKVEWLDLDDFENCGRKVVDNATGKVLFESSVQPEEREERWSVQDENGQKCKGWLNEHFPEWGDPFAYWD